MLVVVSRIQHVRSIYKECPNPFENLTRKIARMLIRTASKPATH
jgi:hypothetical protein